MVQKLTKTWYEINEVVPVDSVKLYIITIKINNINCNLNELNN